MGNSPKSKDTERPGKPKAPVPMEETESEVEVFHRGNSPETRRALAMLEEDSTVSIRAPSPLKKGHRELSPGAVGLRQAAESKGDPEEKVERLRSIKAQLRDKRDERRQEMWDKLDNARKSADERLERYSGFEPSRQDETPEPRRARPRRARPRHKR